MHPRARIALVWGGLALLVLLAYSLGRARGAPEQRDRRPSTLLTGPDGARGLADALERLDVEVVRWRGRLREFAGSAAPSGRHRVLALLDPSRGLEDHEVAALAGWHEAGEGGLLLVGPRAAALMQCFGWTTGLQTFAPVAVQPPGYPLERPPSVSRFLVPDSSVAAASTDTGPCELAAVQSVDTLFVAEDGSVAGVWINLNGRNYPVVLLSDADLVRNRTLRDTDAGPLVLGLFADYGVVAFDEGSHGFGRSGSLAGAVLAWSRRSPWGWAFWQLALVGVLALLAGAVRFGPVHSILERRRRSPLEHVNALANALSAARGHDVAIAALVRGLRRRLTPNTAPAAEPEPWLRDLAGRAPSPGARDRALELLNWTRPGQPAPAVLSAAATVEDLWEDLHR